MLEALNRRSSIADLSKFRESVSFVLLFIKVGQEECNWMSFMIQSFYRTLVYLPINNVKIG